MNIRKHIIKTVDGATPTVTIDRTPTRGARRNQEK